MTQRSSVVLVAVLIALLCPLSVRAAGPEAARTADPCEEQRLKVLSLEKEREEMLVEIQELQKEVAILNQTIDNIRSQVGGGEPAPTSSGKPYVE